jgi:very-short-patch-repair endonuclease
MSRLYGIHKAAADLSARLESLVLSSFDTNPIDSPIERLLYISAVTFIENFGHDYGLNGLMRGGHDGEPEFGEVEIAEQVRVLDWPVDFVFRVGVYGGTVAMLAVECDGHDFHERTKEQAARDRSRGRALQAAGYTVMRFTGSELYRDPIACVLEIVRWAVTQAYPESGMP